MDYNKMTVAQLRSIAKEKGIRKAASLKKQELLDAFAELERIGTKALEDTAEAVTGTMVSAEGETEEAKEEVKEVIKEEVKEKVKEKVKEEIKEEIREETGVPERGTGKKAALENSTGTESGKAEIAEITEESGKVAEAGDPEIKPGEESSDLNPSVAAEGEPDADGQNQNTDRSRSDNTPGFNRGDIKEGILEIMPDGYGFIRSENFLPGDLDVYVSPLQIRKLNLRKGDLVVGITKQKVPGEKFNAMLYCKTVNGFHPYEAPRRPKFENLTPVFPHERLRLETPGCTPSMRIMDILSPIGKGQRGMIVSQPKAGKTTLLKQIAKAITTNNPEIYLMILLIDERPEEVTDMKESIQGENVTVVYSTFDELPENHKRVSEMVIERAKRLVEQQKDVVILLDSITRLARAYNLTCAASGRTLSGGLDPAALHMPKKFFGAARCMREGGSLTVLATALVETGSRMDDVVFEEFKGTGNMELVLDRNLSEKRIFPAIDLPRSSTRRDDLLLTKDEQEVNEIIRHAFNTGKTENAVEKIINMFARTRNNREFCEIVKKTKLF